MFMYDMTFPVLERCFSNHTTKKLQFLRSHNSIVIQVEWFLIPILVLFYFCMQSFLIECVSSAICLFLNRRLNFHS